MAQTLPDSMLMNLFDLFIIYLACGAPFGAYHLVNQRQNSKYDLFKPIFISLFWIPFAFNLLQNSFKKKSSTTIYSKKDVFNNEKSFDLKKKLEQILIKSNFGVSVFEIREVIERYIGLTDALENKEAEYSANPDFFEIAGNKNSNLASICLQRRNRKLLSYHQMLAGQDFLKLISDFIARSSSINEIKLVTLKLVENLNDKKTEKKLELIFEAGQQSLGEKNVNKPEKKLWMKDTHQQPTAETLRISMNPAAAAKSGLIIKD